MSDMHAAARTEDHTGDRTDTRTTVMITVKRWNQPRLPSVTDTNEFQAAIRSIADGNTHGYAENSHGSFEFRIEES